MSLRKMTRFAGILFSFVILISMLSVPALADQSGSPYSLNNEDVEYYGRSILPELENSAALIYAYDRIVEGVESCSGEIYVYDGANPISYEELQLVMDIYSRDYAHHFWLNNGYMVYSNSDSVVYIEPSYLMTGSKLEKAKEEFDQAALEILSGVTASMSEYEIELYIHDTLAGLITYSEGENAHNAYGALIDGFAVCEGYAEALQYLLQCCGIQSFLVSGVSFNPSTNAAENHKWNCVRIDGKYYHTDLTWNDQDEDLFHAYFNQSDEVLGEDHFISSTVYPLPECNSADAQYFTGKAEYLDEYTVDSMGELLKNNNLKVNVYIPGSVSDFISWYTSNIAQIGGKAGISGGFSYGYYSLGREFVLYIIYVCPHSSLTTHSQEPASCTLDGHKAYYECKSCHKLFADPSALVEITDLETWKKGEGNIPALEHDYSEKVQDNAHLKYQGANCNEYNVYWYDCSRCEANAANDSNASDKYWTGSVKGPHQYTLASQKDDALKSGGTCCSNAIYYYSCTHCGGVEENDDHVFTGDKDPNVHAGGTELIGALAADHKNQIAGYTGDTKCLGCNKILEYGQTIQPGAHIPGSGWCTDGEYHWKECSVAGCGIVIEGTKAKHSSTEDNVADCRNQAVCDVCGGSYGSLGEHDWSSDWSCDSSGHWHGCNTAGCNEKVDFAIHTPDHEGGASDEYEVKCTICKYVIHEKLAHVHSFDREVVSDTYKASNATCIKAATYYKSCKCGEKGTETFTHGSTADHNYNAEIKNAETLKSSGNCRDEAVYYYSCSVCGKVEHNDSHLFTGEKDFSVHVGGTEIVGASEADHKKQIAGYTGNTKCLGCGKILEYGQTIQPGAHIPGSDWCTDGEYHWKECSVAGCGEVIEGSKVKHYSTGSNKSTCLKQAVCDICKESYGDVAEHDWSDILSSDQTGHWYECKNDGCAERKDFAEHTPDHEGGASEDYAVKCSICQYVIHSQLNHTHEFNEEIVSDVYKKSDATCESAAIYYKSCKCGAKGTETFVYGAPKEHDYTDMLRTADALKTPGNCRDGAVYYYSCSACGKVEHNDSHLFTGEKDFSVHVGGTEIVDASEADHKNQIAGYTGNSKCLGCGNILEYGQTISPGEHVAGEMWSGDEEYHWKVCSVPGCGVVIDGTKVKHSSTGSNVATCQKKAVCDVCDCFYGDAAEHDWSDSWTMDENGHWHSCRTAGCTAKNDFAEHTPDHEGGASEDYAVKCVHCYFMIHPQLNHTHVFDVENPIDAYKASGATCQKRATYYKSCECGAKGEDTFEYGDIEAHNPGTEWIYDESGHWHICSNDGCGAVIDESFAQHTPDREEPTATDPIKCSVCGYVIEKAGEVHSHVLTKVEANPASCSENGNKEYYICSGCDMWFEDALGTVVINDKSSVEIPKGHSYSTELKHDDKEHWNECECGAKANVESHKDSDNDGKCDACGVGILPVQTPAPAPAESNNMMMILIGAGAGVLAIAVVVIIVIKKKR